MTLKTRIAEVRALDEKRTPGGFIYTNFPVMENVDGTLTPVGGTKHCIRAIDIDEQGRRVNRFVAELYYQAGDENAPNNNGEFLAAAPTMLTIINELTDKLTLARNALKYEADRGNKRAQVALKLTDIGE